MMRRATSAAANKPAAPAPMIKTRLGIENASVCETINLGRTTSSTGYTLKH
jgi:hypothetical protein